RILRTCDLISSSSTRYASTSRNPGSRVVVCAPTGHRGQRRLQPFVGSTMMNRGGKRPQGNAAKRFRAVGARNLGPARRPRFVHSYALRFTDIDGLPPESIPESGAVGSLSNARLRPVTVPDGTRCSGVADPSASGAADPSQDSALILNQR